MFDAVCLSNSPFLTVDFHDEQTVRLKSRNPREFIQSQLVTFAISSESRCAAKSLSILNRPIPYPIFHVWWMYRVNHTGFLHPLHSVCFNICASRVQRVYRTSRRRSAATSPLTIHRHNMSFSDAKTLLTLQKSNSYLQQETKIIKSEERRADDPNSGAISTDCSTTSSHRI